MSTSSTFGAASPVLNPFASASKTDIQSNPFCLNQRTNAFGASSVPNSSTIGSTITSLGLESWPKSIKPPSNDGQASFPNPFAGANKNANSIFSAGLNANKLPSQTLKSSTGAPLLNSASTISTSQKPFEKFTGMKNHQKLHSTLDSPLTKPILIENNVLPRVSSTMTPSTSPEKQLSNLAEKIESHLYREGIIPPSLNSLDYNKDQGDFIRSVTELRKEFLKYRDKVRASLIKANLLDDPNVPKKLKDAIDFKGTCDQMCPEYECVTRMVDRRYDKTERDIQPDGSLSIYPNPVKMVKALARSAAGQDAPLPCDIRTAAALRRTVDYLFKTILGERDLETVHGFLWDRTRAVRRDFVFHSSMTSSELVDQVYCLERITRFHAISLHHMSKDTISAEGFSDQQELEQLSKSLLSLIHAYEDCKLQGVHCENEIEFKAYYVLFNGENPGIMETVHNWGSEVWGKSEIVQTAVSLSESLQNTWDVHGPLFPASTSEISQNAYSKFFSIVEDPNVSYTMACFAEIYFNKVRKAILRTILSSYRKQRGQTKDWTPEKLNQILRFDTEDEIEPFVELYGLHFAETDGEWCLSFDSTNNIQDPHPLPKQHHSYHLVERKRGEHSLSEAINCSIYDKIALESNATPSVLKDNLSEVHFPPKLDILESKLGTDMGNGISPKPKFVRFEDENSCSNFRDNAKSVTIFNCPTPPKTSTQTLFPALELAPSKEISNLSTLDSVLSSPKEPSTSYSLFPQLETSKKNTNFSSFFAFPNKVNPNLSNPQSSTLLPSQNSKSTDAEPKNSTSNSIKMVALQHFSPATTPQNLPSQQSNSTLVATQPALPANNETNTPLTFVNFDQQSLVPMPLQNANPSIVPQELPMQSSFPLGKTANEVLKNHKPASILKKQFEANNNYESQMLLTDQRPCRLDCLTRWIVNGDQGLFQEFWEIQAYKIVQEAFAMFVTDQKIRAQKEAESLALSEAIHFRWRSLAIKYGYFWREQARCLRLKRKGREAREARRLMAKQSRSDKAALSASIVEDFKASTTLRRRPRNSPEISPDEAAVSSGADDFNSETRSVGLDSRPSHKRHRSERSMTSEFSSTSRNNGCLSNTVFSRSLLSDPSFLSGEPRIHLLSRHLNRDEKLRQPSGVQTDYFRLKARGIVTHPDLTPLSNKAATHILHRCRSFEGLHNSVTKKSLNFSETVDDKPKIESVKIKTTTPGFAMTAMQESCNSDEDFLLFDRARRVRDQMDEGADWFRKEVQRAVNDSGEL